MTKHDYNVSIRWNVDRKGIMCSPELSATNGSGGCIEVATPPQFPKGVEGIWSPEHLFTAAVSSCFMTTFLAIAENSKLNFLNFECDATGVLEEKDGKYLMTEIQLKPVVLVKDEQDTDRALRVLQRTEKNCLISNSINSTITMIPKINISGVSQNV
jgi:organic hydroperoxide reductase OsmC/OhrA